MAPPVKSALRVLELLEFFAEEQRAATMSEVMHSLSWPQSSTSVLLRSLVEAGFFEHDARTGLYAPSIRLSLATGWIQDHLYSEQSLLRLMREVSQRTGHTVMIGTRSGVHVRYLHVIQATREGRFTARIGSLRPLFGSAAGRMLLTTVRQREVAMLWRKASAVERDTHPVPPLEQVWRDIEAARTQGFAQSHGTSVPGASALAVLIPTGSHREPMTLSVGGPIAEVEAEREHLLEVLRTAIAPMLRSLGWQPH